MEVILKKDVPNLGRIGQVINVKPGYARNYLIPRSMAVLASRGNKKELEHQQRLIESQKKKVRAESEERAKEISKVKIELKKRFNDQDKMFGSISTSELADALKAKGYEFDKRDIELGDIRDEGTHKVKVRLPGDVFTEIQLHIEALRDEAKKTSKKAKGEKKATKAKKAADTDEASDEEVTEKAAKPKAKKAKSKADEKASEE